MGRRETEVFQDPRGQVEERVTEVWVELLVLSDLPVHLESPDLKDLRDQRDLLVQRVRRETPV